MTLADAPAVLTVEEAAQILRLGRSAAYEAVRRGEIPSIRVGRLVRIPTHRLAAMLGIPEKESAPPGPEPEGLTKTTVAGGQDEGYPG